MLDLADLEYYCYSGVWNIGAFKREWMQYSKERRAQQKIKKKTSKQGQNQEKSSLSGKLQTPSNSGSRTNLKNSEDPKCESLQPEDVRGSSEEELEASSGMTKYKLSIPLLSRSNLHMDLKSKCLPCGCLTELLCAEMSYSPIIIKREKPNSQHSTFNILQRELEVLVQVHHPNILLIMGIIKMDVNSMVIVFEEASNGTLHYILHEKKMLLSLSLIQKLLVQLCHVMIFLHERGWLHTAITSHTVLLTANYTLKLTGFESAQNTETGVVQQKINKESLSVLQSQWFQWKAPEQLTGNHSIGKHTDVFSAGLVGWEMCTNIEPWSGCSPGEVKAKYQLLKCAVGQNGLLTPKLPQEFVQFLKNMLQMNPLSRSPCFLNILAEIQNLQVVLQNTPRHVTGSVEKAQLYFHSLPQKLSYTCNQQSQIEDTGRDPYTGLRRVQRCWERSNIFISNSATSINTEVPKSNGYRQRNSLCNMNENINNNTEHLTGKRNYTSHTKMCNEYFPRSRAHKNSANNDVNEIEELSSGFLGKLQNKYQEGSQSSLPIISPVEEKTSQPVPIKPASHQNQRAISFRKNCLGVLPGVLCPVSNKHPQKVSNEYTCRWETATGRMETTDTNTNRKMKFINENTNENCIDESVQLLEKNRKHKDTKNSIKGQNINGNNSVNTKTEHWNTVNTEEPLESKNNVAYTKRTRYNYCEKESTIVSSTFCIHERNDKIHGYFNCEDNGISEEHSTEDLYIDDEFSLDMELDSHMQLLCFSDSSSEYGELLRDTQLPVNEEENSGVGQEKNTSKENSEIIYNS